MIRIEYPKKHPAIRNQNGAEQVRCICRKKWVALTPEEWVRQNFLLYLTMELHYPLALIAVERTIDLGDRKRRFDILVFNAAGFAVMLVECKEMNIALSPVTLNQILAYQSVLQSRILVVTNGLECIAAKVNGNIQMLEELPAWDLINCG